MMLTKEELKKLKDTRSAEEWNAVCDEIKSVRNGQYPEDWWGKVQMSGLMASISSKWNAEK